MAVVRDISPRIDGSLAVFPGDTPPGREVLLDMARGDSLTLSTLRTTVHLGAHVDAPSHYGQDADTIDRVPLERFVGRCRVIATPAEPGRRIPASVLPPGPLPRRVLLATGSYPDPSAPFERGFAALSVGLVEELHRRGALLVGVDTPSVDLVDSKDLPAHRACLRCGLSILEGLVLAGVEPGDYELIALPLPLVGFDASPVRAVLRDLD